MTRKALSSPFQNHAGCFLSCVFVCDPNSFLVRARYWGVEADAAGMSEEKGVECEFSF